MHGQNMVDGPVDPTMPGSQGEQHEHQHQGARHNHPQGPFQPPHYALRRDPEHQ